MDMASFLSLWSHRTLIGSLHDLYQFLKEGVFVNVLCKYGIVDVFLDC